jgi:hypothetical protein
VRMESSSSIAQTSSNRRRSFSSRLRRPTRWTGRYLSVCPLRRPSPAEHGRTRPRKRRCHEQQREQWIRIGLGIAQVDSEDSVEAPRPQPPLPTEPALAEDRADAQQPTSHATREGSDGKSGIEKSKLIMLGGGLLAAVLFLALTSLVNHSPLRRRRPRSSQAIPRSSKRQPIQGKRHALDGDRSDQRSGEYLRAGASGRHQAHQHSGTGRGR